jgi:hypothetical protein
MKFKAKRFVPSVVTSAGITLAPVNNIKFTPPAPPDSSFSITEANVVPVCTPENSYILKYKSSPELLPPVNVGAEVERERPIHK